MCKLIQTSMNQNIMHIILTYNGWLIKQYKPHYSLNNSTSRHLLSTYTIIIELKSNRILQATKHNYVYYSFFLN